VAIKGVVGWVLCVLVLTSPALAQLGPHAPLLAQQTLTPFGLDAPDAVEGAFFTVNPAANVALGDFGVKRIIEQDVGRLDFAAGPKVDSYVQTLAWVDGNNYWKVARYDFDSDPAAVPRVFPEDVKASFSGESWALTWARQDDDLRWGLSFLPKNETQTRLYLANGVLQRIAYGEAYSTFSVRLGAQKPITETLTLGAVYNYEHNKTNFTAVSSGLDTAAAMAVAGSYDTNVGVLGLAWRPQMGTTVAADFEHGHIEGPFVSESINIWYFSVEQFLSPNWAAKITNLDDAWGIGVNYFKGTDYNIGASYAPSGFRRTSEYLGKCDLAYLWLAKSW